MRKIVCLLVGMFCAVAVSAASFSLNDLMKQIKIKTPTEKVHFIEARTMHFLDKPITSTGTYYFKKPYYIEKQVQTPKSERIMISHQTLTLIDKNHDIHNRALADYPNLWAFITIFRALLSGNAYYFHRYFLVTLSGSMKQWHMLIKPKQGVNLQMRTMRVSGNQNKIKTIRLIYPNGDSVFLQLSAVKQ